MAGFFALAALGLPGGPSLAAAAPDSIGSLRTRQEEALVELLLVRRRLADVQGRLTLAERRLQGVEQELAEGREWERRTAADLEKAQERLSLRARETYKSGGSGWLEVLVGASDLGDFMQRVDLLGLVFAQEERLVRSIAAKKEEAARARAELEAAESRQRESVSELGAAKAKLQAAGHEKERLADKLGHRLALAEEAARRAEEKMAEINRRSQPAKASRGDGRAEAAVPSVRKRPPTSTSMRGPGDAGGGSPAPQGRQLQVKATAYYLTGSTATGVPAGPGIIAVDPRVIPLGTRLFVPGYGEGIAADTGGAVKGDFIDVWLPRPQAEAWGVKHLTITILG